MKAIILFKPNTETERSVSEYVREFARETGKEINLIDVESVEGVEMAKLYDILQTPAIVTFRDDGTIVEAWTEQEKWPTIAELSFYNQS